MGRELTVSDCSWNGAGKGHERWKQVKGWLPNSMERPSTCGSVSYCLSLYHGPLLNRMQSTAPFPSAEYQGSVYYGLVDSTHKSRIDLARALLGAIR